MSKNNAGVFEAPKVFLPKLSPFFQPFFPAPAKGGGEIRHNSNV